MVTTTTGNREEIPEMHAFIVVNSVISSRVLSREEGKRRSTGVMGRTSVEQKKTPESKEFNTNEKDGVVRNGSVSPESAVFTKVRLVELV